MLEIMGIVCSFSFLIVFIIVALLLQTRARKKQYGYLKEYAEELGVKALSHNKLEGSYKGYAFSGQFLEDIDMVNHVNIKLTLTCSKPFRGEMSISSKLLYNLLGMGPLKAITLNDSVFDSNFNIKTGNMSLAEVNTILTPDIKNTMFELKKERAFSLKTHNKSICFTTYSSGNDKNYLKEAMELMVNILKNYREIR